MLRGKKIKYCLEINSILDWDILVEKFKQYDIVPTDKVDSLVVTYADSTIYIDEFYDTGVRLRYNNEVYLSKSHAELKKIDTKLILKLEIEPHLYSYVYTISGVLLTLIFFLVFVAGLYQFYIKDLTLNFKFLIVLFVIIILVFFLVVQWKINKQKFDQISKMIKLVLIEQV